MFSWFRKKEIVINQKEVKEQKIPNFDDTQAKEILLQIKQEFGLDYTKQEYITLRKIERFAIKNEIFDFSQLHNMITTSNEIKEKLINMLTVGETYFYRELGHFKILVNLMEEKKIQNILCAPSSSGEEIYSILLFVQEYFHKLKNLHITGIDINSEAISLAQDACFSNRSISQLPIQILEKNFTYNDSQYCIHKQLQSYTTFIRQNIFDFNSLQKIGKFEVIFCRNMLIYFNETQKKEALSNLRELLVEDGFLFVGHADISFTPNGFQKILTSDGSYFQKSKL